MHEAIADDVTWLYEHFGRSGNFSGDTHARWSYCDNAVKQGYRRSYFFPDAADYAEFALCRGNI